MEARLFSKNRDFFEKVAQQLESAALRGKNDFLGIIWVRALLEEEWEGQKETVNNFGGFQTPFTISIKDFCGASVQDSSQYKSPGSSSCSNSKTLEFDKKSGRKILAIKFGIKFEWLNFIKNILLYINIKYNNNILNYLNII